MANNNHKLQCERTTDQAYSSKSAERRCSQRRNQLERREIERFGYEIMSRRSGGERRETV